MRLAKTTLVHFFSQVGKSAAGFFITLYLSRSVGAGVLGEYFIVIALLAWLTIPINAVSNAVQKRISEDNQPQSHLSSGFVICVLISTFICVIIMSFQSWLENYIGAPVVFLMLLLFFAQSLYIYMSAGLNGQKMVAKSGFFQFVERIFRGGGQIGLVYLGYEIGGILIGHVISLLFVGSFGFFFYDISFVIPRRKHFNSLFSYAQYSWLGSLKDRSFSWMDTIVLNFFVASSLVGIYEITWRLASILVILSVSISQTVFPEISDISSDGDYDEVHNLLNEALTFSGLFVIPGFVGALILGSDLLQIYGREFMKGSIILLVLIAARGLGAYQYTFVQTINAINRPDIAFRVNLVLVLTNVILNVVLIYLFGWYGAAVATAVSSFLSLYAAYRGISGVIGKPEIPTKEILSQSLAASAMGVGVWFASKYGSSIYFTMSLVIMGAFLYGGVLIVLSNRFRNKILSFAPYSL